MKIIVCGASGRMGRQLLDTIKDSKGAFEAIAAVDVVKGETDCPFYTSLDEVKERADVLIDFSHHSATASIIDYAKKTGTAVIIATTGQTDEEKQTIKAAGSDIPVFFSGNMSLGIALLASLAAKTAALFPDADIEIVETHHKMKLDVPSGTALLLAERIKEARNGNATFCIGRHENGLRTQKEIGIHSLRLGGIVGEHEVRINTGTQCITLKHEAYSRALFAEGALAAAAYLEGCESGLYTLSDLLK